MPDPTRGLIIQGLGYAYGADAALDGISFEVGHGDFCALLGPNGAGKSTLFALLTRLFAAQTGRIAIAGNDLGRHPRRALAQIGVVFQQPTLDLDLTVRRNLLYGAALHGMSGRCAGVRIDAVLDRLNMRARADERVRNLNGGHRRRAEIARALLHDPAVLLLDEPTVGLDAASRQAIVDYAHDLCGAAGMTVLWATHLVDEVRLSDRLIVLHRGRVLADGIAGEIAGALPLADRFLAMTGEPAAGGAGRD